MVGAGDTCCSFTQKSDQEKGGRQGKARCGAWQFLPGLCGAWFPCHNPMNSLINQQQRHESSQGAWWPFQLWYRLTSPPEPADSASFEERDLFRRGRTGSQIAIFLFILTGISFPAAFAGSNSFLVSILAIDLVVLTI